MNEKKIQQIRTRHATTILRSNVPHVALQAHDDRATLLAEIEKLYTELDKAQRHIELLQNKVDMEKSCACAYDTPDDVCLPHSPLLAAAQAKIDWLGKALLYYADENRYKPTSVHMCGHSTGQAVLLDGGKKAREALEAKP